jgi:outer membrane protein
MLSLTRRVVILIYTGLMLMGGGGCASWLSHEPPRAYAPARVSPSTPSSPQTSSPEAPPFGPEPTPASPAPGPLAPLTPPPPGAGEAPEMTLDRLLDIALANRPNISASQAARDAAKARLGTTRADYFPSVNTTYGYNRATNNIAGGINPSTGNPIQRNISNISVNNNNFTATLTQNVFDSFRREGRVQAAREDLNAADLDLSTTRQNVILSVQQAYYNYILALRLVAVQQEAVNANLQNLNQAKGFFEVGTRPKIDVTQAQVQLANAELALVQARNQAATALAALNNAIGVPDLPPYHLKEALERPATIPSLNDSIQAALTNRSEIHAAQARVRSAEASLTVAKRNFLPSLNASANWSYRGQDYPLAPNWLAGMTLAVPVLTPPLYSQLDEVAANLASAQTNEEITRQNIILEIQQNYANLTGAQESIRASEVFVQQARETLELAQGRYQVGVGPLIDITNAQLALTQAEAQNITAIVNFKLAEAGLRKAMGLLD